MDITPFINTPLFQLKAVNCDCILTWITRAPEFAGHSLVGVPAYELAVMVDWEKCKTHNPELKEKEDGSKPSGG